MKNNSGFTVAFLILAYCIWNASGIAKNWFHFSFYEHYSWIILLVWLVPLFYFWISSSFKDRPPINSIMLGLALLVSLLGELGSLNILTNFGLSMALAAFVPWTFNTLVWLVCSFTWMPGSSWLSSYIFTDHYILAYAVRLMIAAASSSWLIIKRY